MAHIIIIIIANCYYFALGSKDPRAKNIKFNFRATGSTTGAVIYLLHVFTELLQSNDYIHVIALDFSKDFDNVRHH